MKLKFISNPWVLSLTFVVFLFFGGCRALTTAIYHSMDCHRFNIDHIELRTGINVPRIDSVLQCELVPDQSRIIKFHIDPRVDIRTYAYTHFSNDTAMLFRASGTKLDVSWRANLDTNTRILLFELDYHN